MCVQLQEEALVKLEGAGELLHQLPNTLQELVHHGGHLLKVSVQVSVPVGFQVTGLGQGSHGNKQRYEHLIMFFFLNIKLKQRGFSSLITFDLMHF